MQAVILAGGFGTRLRPLTCNIPKPMTPLLNIPIIEHNVNLLKYHGIKELIIILYYQSEIIKAHFRDGKKWGVNINYVKPDADYGTAGAVYFADEFIKDTFIILSGDVVTDFNITHSVSFHIKNSSLATIVLTRAKNPLQFGIVLTEKKGKITKFFEKPTWSEVFSDTINTGIYILEKRTLELIPKSKSSSKPEIDFSKDLFPYLLKNKLPLYGCIERGYWRDVGSLEEYINANMDALKGKVKLPWLKKNVKNGNIILSVKGVSKNATIENCIIGKNCKIGQGSKLSNVILWDNDFIGDNCNLTNAVLCNNVKVKNDSNISENVFIGDNVTVGMNVDIKPGIKIWPDKKIDSNSTVHKSLIWEERWKDSLFADSRITGLANIEITPEFAAKLGIIFGVFLGKKSRVLTSRDTDFVSRMIKGAIISGLMSSGIDVIDLQTSPVPIIRQELKSGNASGGIFVRKSPFDASKIDIIFFDADGKDLSTSKTKSIERLYFAGDYIPTPFYEIGSVSYPERTYEKYKNYFFSFINPDIINKRHFKIAVNYSHGITSSIFPLILGNYKIELVSLDTHLDSTRQTRSSEDFKTALRKLSFVVTSLKYDVGFLIDAGGEKIFLVDDKGKIISYDRFLSLVINLFLSLYPDTKKIAVPIQASGEIDMIARRYGTEVMRVKDSHYAMMTASEDPQISLVGGTKGGVIFPDFLHATDGMFSIIKILELLAYSDKSLSEIEKETPKLYMHKENLFCTKEDKGKIMRKLVESTVDMKRQLIDGIKVFYNEYKWVLCIPDSEREIFHINAEAKTHKDAVQLVKEYSNKIKMFKNTK